MAEQWLIDGYNLLYALQSQDPQRSSPSREQMFAFVAEFASFKKLNTLIVLDGTGNDAELSAYRTDCLEVVYSQKVPADTYIERYLFENRDKKRLVVVTNDRAIGNIACGCGAGLLSTSLFWEQLKASQKDSGDLIQKQRSKQHGFNRPFEDKLKDL